MLLSGQFDEKKPTWLVHLWLINTAVKPRTYLHVPAVLDTGYEGELSLPLREAKKLKLERDVFIPLENCQDASGHIIPMVTYNAVLALVPMLDKPEGSLDHYKSGRLHPTSSLQPGLPDGGHSQAAENADQAVKAAGEAAIDSIKDKSEAWVKLSPVKHPRHDCSQEQPLLGLAGMDRLGLHLDREKRSVRTFRMRNIIRADDLAK